MRIKPLLIIAIKDLGGYPPTLSAFLAKKRIEL
jgi:hypothetical protein